MDDSSLRTVHQLLPSTTLVIPAVITLVQDWVTSSPKDPLKTTNFGGLCSHSSNPQGTAARR